MNVILYSPNRHLLFYWLQWLATLFLLLLLTSSAGSADSASSAQLTGNTSTRQLAVLDISERSIEGRNVIAVLLSEPLDASVDHQRYMDLAVINGDETVDGAWVLSDNRKMLWFSNTQPETSYQLVVDAGLTSVDGYQLASEVTVDLVTRSLVPSVSFSSSGMFLTHGSGKGLPISTLNVDRADIEFFRVREDRTDQFLTEFSGSYNKFYSLRYVANFADLVYSGHYSLAPPANTLTNKTIEVSGIEALQSSGLYLAVMRQSGSYGKPSLIWFSVTDLGLQVRSYERQLDVHVASLASGRAVGGVMVTLTGRDGKVLDQLESDMSGVVNFAIPADTIKMITAAKGSHYSLVEMRKPALDLSEFNPGLRPQHDVEVFIYSARDLYRPGESIDFNALVRNSDGQAIRPPVLQVRLQSPDGSEVKRFSWASREAGYYHHHWTIPHDAAVGSWRMQVSSAISPMVVYTFKVEEFLPERLKLSLPRSNSRNGQQPVTNGADQVVNGLAAGLVVGTGQSLELPLHGEYLYGAPAAGNRLGIEAQVSLWRNPLDVLSHYVFGDVDETQYQRRLSIDDMTLDDEGNALVTVASEWRNASSPLRVKVVGSLYETGGRPVSRAFSTLVWPRNSMLGIRSSFSDNNPQANSQVSFDIVRANLAGDKLAADDINVALIREERRYFWVYSESQGWHYEWTDKEYTEHARTIDIQRHQSARVEFPVEWGSYRIEVRDSKTGLLSSERFYAGEDWYSRWQNKQSLVRPDQITLALDKKSYRVGDTIKLRVTPPDAGEALVLVESDQPLWSKQVSLPAVGAIVEIPVAEDWQQHNIYLSVNQIRPSDNVGGITPKRSFGLIHLPLDRSDRELKIDFDVPEKVLPSQTFNASLSVTQLGGQQLPDKVYITLAAVDAGALAITDFQTPKPHVAFFGARRYSVEIKDLYSQVIEVSNAEPARMKFGGDADLARGGDQSKADVHIVSLFSGLVTVNGDGQVQVPLELPDFNGRLRLMAVAFGESSFGSAEREVVVAAPLVSQLAKPRFLATGDDSQLALDVHNLSGEHQHLVIDTGLNGPLQFKGVDGKPDSAVATRQLYLADGEKQTLRYDVRAGDFAGVASIALQMKSDQLNTILHRQWQLTIRSAYPLHTSRQAVVLAKHEQVSVNTILPEKMISTTASAEITLSGQPDLQLRSHLRKLLQYPYGCLEQTSSRVYPLVLATQDVQQRFDLQPVDMATRVRMIQSGIDRLSSLQLTNGGFGLWSHRSAEEHWLTAYVADMLLTARDMGVNTPPELLQKSLRRLQKYLASRGTMLAERWSDDSDHYRFAYRSYAAYVLSRVNQAPLGTLRTLYEKRQGDAKTGLPLIHLGIALQNMGDHRRGQLAIEAGLSLPRSERRSYYGDYGSNIRDTALMIHLLSTHSTGQQKSHQKTHSAVIELGLELIDALRARRWLSTQERNALFLAGLAMQVQKANRWQAQLGFNAQSRNLSGTSSQRVTLGAGQLIDGLVIGSKSGSPLYVTSRLSAYPASAPAAYRNILSIERSWYNIDGELIDPAVVQTGELVLVKLAVRAEQATPDSLLVDLLPAGFELENQNLNHALKLDELLLTDGAGTTLAELLKETRTLHQEYRDDRYVAAIDLPGYGVQQVVYLMRAVTPGRYQVPPPSIEDMYRPEHRALGVSRRPVTVVNRP